MPRNVEIKARIESVDAMLPVVAALSDSGPVEILQDDTFFPCATGRLKLREFTPTSGELIFYQRADEQGPKESFFLVSPTSAPGTLRESLTHAYGQAGRVQKRRTLYLVGRTRVHLDRVTGLGDFLELEVVLAEHEPSEAGVSEAHALMEQLGIAPGQLVKGAYVDLVTQSAAARDDTAAPGTIAARNDTAASHDTGTAARRPYPRYPLAVHLFLLRGDEILMLRRCNTGYEDGKLSVVAGHVEPGEPITEAAVREAREEVGIMLAPERLHLVGVMHRSSDEERVDIFLTYALDATDAEPVNCEPGKCSELIWMPLTRLPDDTIPYVRAGIDGYRRGEWFQEFGWKR